MELYPSITENLLCKAINFAENYIQINEETIDVIRKSILLHDEYKCIKKDGKIFDVTMGSYNGA